MSQTDAMMRKILFTAVVAVVAIAGCSTGDVAVEDTAGSTVASTVVGSAASKIGCADVVDAVIESTDDGTYRVSATVRSSDTGDEKYADAWEVRAPDGSVLATRVLAHPHVGEQPFTRSLAGVVIPDGTGRVEIAAHDSVEGFCGATLNATVPEG
jgi:hypothetical protein